MYKTGPVTLELIDYLIYLAIWKIVFTYVGNSERVFRKIQMWVHRKISKRKKYESVNSNEKMSE